MAPFHKILFPVDFSTASEAMVPYVREMARVCAAQLTVLHSFDLVRGYNLAGRLDAMGESERSPIPYTAPVAKLRDREAAHLPTFVREQFPDMKCSAIMEDGDPAAIIHAVARRDGIDLIMMPTRGLGTFRRLLLGSVTAKVLHDVDCAVFTSVHDVDSAMAHFAGFRAMICGIRLDEEGQAVLGAARLFAQASGAKLSTLHITPAQPPELGTNTADLAPADVTREGGATGVVSVISNDVAEGIRRAAIEDSADLVIVGRGHDRGPVSRLWSDLYRIVRESPCPVLSV